MSLIAAAAALARPIGLPPSYEDRAARALNQELESARAILAMRLDDQTRAALIAIARPHVAELNALERAKRESAASVASAMKDLRAAVLANQGVSEDVKRSVRQAEEGYKAIQERIERALPERASATWSLLSTAQGAALRRSARAGDEDEGAWLRRLIERREQREFNRARPANSAFGRPDRPGRADLRAGRMHPNRRPFESDRILEGLYRQYGLRDEEIQRALSFGRSLMKDAQPEDERLGREPFLR
ncbi:MAG: hypothetical protein MUF51_05195, partial [Vicinamibacteria bacterium]|nr:hypothetical protein [Vicinamibacteria bacterium]